MTDEEGRDDKIIAVAVDDPEFSHCNDVAELPPPRLREIQQFLRDYKSLEGKIAASAPFRAPRRRTRSSTPRRFSTATRSIPRSASPPPSAANPGPRGDILVR